MPQVIKDGDSGYTAHVDDHGRLYTLANTVGHLQHHSWYHQDAFMTTHETTMADATEKPVAYFKNTDSNNDFEFYIVTVNANANAIVRIYFDGEYTSGGGEVIAVNMFRGSGNTLSNVTFYEGGASGDLVIDSTNAVSGPVMYLSANQPTPVDFQGALIFRNGRSAYMTVEAAGGTKVAVNTMSSYHTTGTKL